MGTRDRAGVSRAGHPAMVGSVSSESISHQEVHFLAEDEHLDIVPNFSLQGLHLLGGTYGPFRPQMRTSVPLWLAMLLINRESAPSSRRGGWTRRRCAR